jgi:hypothetical protein
VHRFGQRLVVQTGVALDKIQQFAVDGINGKFFHIYLFNEIKNQNN